MAALATIIASLLVSFATVAAQGISAQDARTLPDAELSMRALTSISADVVDVDRPTGPEPFVGIGLALRPKPGWNGVCEATLLRLSFGDGPDGETEAGTVSAIDTVTVYKVRSNPDENVDQDDQRMATLCAGDRPFKDAYFFAPDGRTAQDAGHLVQIIQAQTLSGRRSFDISCDEPTACRASAERIAGVSVDRIMMVDEVDPCPSNRSCLKIVFYDQGGCAEAWSVVARYKALKGKEWGVISPEKLRLVEQQCAAPAL